MKKAIATTIAAAMLAGLSFGVASAPASAATAVVKHPAHWHMHQVCTTHMHNHHKVKVCHWVKNK